MPFQQGVLYMQKTDYCQSWLFTLTLILSSPGSVKNWRSVLMPLWNRNHFSLTSLQTVFHLTPWWISKCYLICLHQGEVLQCGPQLSIQISKTLLGKTTSEILSSHSITNQQISLECDLFLLFLVVGILLIFIFEQSWQSFQI